MLDFSHKFPILNEAAGLQRSSKEKYLNKEVRNQEMLYFELSVVLLSIGMIGYVSLVSIGTEHILCRKE